MTDSRTSRERELEKLAPHVENNYFDFISKEVKSIKIVNCGKGKNAIFLWVNERGRNRELKKMNFHSILFGEKMPIKTKAEAEKIMNDFLQKKYWLNYINKF